jgi:hypothetical protein
MKFMGSGAVALVIFLIADAASNDERFTRATIDTARARFDRNSFLGLYGHCPRAR